MPLSADPKTQSFEAIFQADFKRLGAQLDCIDFNHKTILISGATGFFGAWLLALCKWVDDVKRPDGFRVIALSRNPAQFLDRHPWAAPLRWLEWITGDVRWFDIPARPVDWVIHAATDSSAEAGRRPELLLDTMVAGTRHMLDCARQCHASRMVLVSSGAVYGSQAPEVSHQSEDSSAAREPFLTPSSYGEGKRAMELLGAAYAEQTDCAVMLARCFAFVGPGLPLDGHFAIGNFIRDAMERPQLCVGGDGVGRRSYLYAADLAIWLMRILSGGRSKRAYNVGSDQDVSIAELAHCVASVLAPGKPVVIENRLAPSAVGNRYVPSIARARQELGLDVWTSLPDAVAATAAWKPPCL
jgi:dTDP-glucose 4,6-dehydratase